jgi:biopolymer transport protein ExbD/biopolymer transport protein TolR
MTSSKRLKHFDEINITPLTDIFLVLLIIMMVVAPMLNSQGLSINLPSVSEASPTLQKEQKVIEIDILPTNEIKVNDQLWVESNDLTQQLRTLKTTFPDGVILRLSPQALHATSMKVLDAVEGAQISALSIVESAI